MARTLNSPVDDQRSEYIYLYELHFSGGVVYLNSGNDDIDFDGETWVAAPGSIVHDTISEVADRKAQQVRLVLGGVNQTIIATFLANNFRGRRCKIFLVHFDPDTGAMETPDLVFKGLQNGDYKVKESRTADADIAGTVNIETRVKSAIGSLAGINSVRSNVISHIEMLRRAEFVTTNDQFFARVPTLVERTIHWGTVNPTISRNRWGDYVQGGEAEGDVF